MYLKFLYFKYKNIYKKYMKYIICIKCLLFICIFFNLIYWEYKLVRSVFLCIYFKIKWMNRTIKVLFIAAYFFPALRQFSNSISKKWLVFGSDPILEPIFCERSEPVTCQIVLHPSEQSVIRSNVRRIWR